MLKFNRRDEPADLRDSGKTPLKPAPYGSSMPGTTAAGTGNRPAGSATTSAAAGAAAASAASTAKDSAVATTPASTSAAPVSATPAMDASIPTVDDMPGSRLFVGVNIKLKGVEISNCDALTVEGQVEATVNSKAMEIAKPGTLTGTATIDVAEIHGEFSGELTARTRLVVHGTGRVSGTIRYGKLIVAEGGELTGDIKRLEGGDAARDTLPLLASGQPPR